MKKVIINLTPDDTAYTALIDEVMNAGDDKLIIVARSDKNKKDDDTFPVEIKHGIYFYVAFDLGVTLVFPRRVSPEQIERAKKNTIERAVIGDMFTILMGNGKSLKKWNYIGEPIIILTSNTNANGAGILLCEEFIEILKAKVGNFSILPSSVHELSIVPDDLDASMDELTRMVKEVNAIEVTDEEYLAARAFKADEWL